VFFQLWADFAGLYRAEVARLKAIKEQAAKEVPCDACMLYRLNCALVMLCSVALRSGTGRIEVARLLAIEEEAVNEVSACYVISVMSALK
jgi:hypothetical protein